MRKLKISIAITSVIIIFLVISIIVLSGKNNNTETNELNYTEEDNSVIELAEEENEITQKSVSTNYSQINNIEYINVEKCISKFLSIINRNSTAYVDKYSNLMYSDEEISEMMLSVLSKDYINKNNINSKNINNYIYNINEPIFFIPTQIINYNEEPKVNSYVVKGLIENQQYKHIMEANLILNMDTENNTFSVEILGNDINIKSIVPTKVDTIAKNDVNAFENTAITEDDAIKEIANLYKRTILGYPEKFYNNYLDEEYRNKRFSSINDFKTYVSENKNTIQQINIKKYREIKKNNKTSYVLVDQYENTYIFELSSIIEYKTLLDNYTIISSADLAAYSQLSNTDKAKYQLNNLIKKVNTKDYNAIYNNLDSTFKNNNYKNLDALKKYIKNNFYDLNTIAIKELDSETYDYCVFECTLENMQNTNESKEITVIIKIKDGTDFDMSFSF